jgi:hypothetical protein
VCVTKRVIETILSLYKEQSQIVGKRFFTQNDAT